jgi:hypothetical protein
LLIFPLVEAIAWMTLSTLANPYPFWPNVDFRFHAAGFSLKILTAMVLSAILLKILFGSGLADRLRTVTMIALVWLTIMLIRIAPGYVNPHYSMREVSRDLGKSLDSFSTIAAVRTETLFNESKLRYESSLDLDWPPNVEIVVIAFSKMGSGWNDLLDKEYHVMKNYSVYVSPEYYRSDSNSLNTAGGVTVTVYKKNGIHSE